MANILATWSNNGRPGLIAASESGSPTTSDEIISRSPRGKPDEHLRSLSYESLLNLENWELASIIISSAFITIAVVVVAVWIHRRRRTGKMGDLNAPTNDQLNVVVITGYDKSSGSNPSEPPAKSEEMADDLSLYGSVIDYVPPSPTLSFRSVIDETYFNRSRAGTGTSFGTVASLESVRSCRSHWSVRTAVPAP